MTDRRIQLRLCPVDYAAACEFIGRYHRHHAPPQGWKFGVGVCDEGGVLRGVITVGRPVARMRDDGVTLEVTRCCTDGTPNAASKLYGAARRAAFAMGYSRLGTYTLPEEGGASLRAAGWRLIGEAGGGRWIHSGVERANTHPLGTKLLWEA